MARFPFRLPDIGEGIAEAEIVRWHVAPGETIAEDAPLVDMMTDKATVEMESPVAGTVLALHGEPGQRVAIGTVLAEIETEADAADAPPAPAAAPSAPAEPRAPGSVAPAAPARGRVLASPAVRARARALGIDLADVRRDGERVRHADLDAFLRYGAAQGYATAPAARPEEQVPVIGLRRRIAEAMTAAAAVPHFTLVEEVEFSALETLRAQLNAGRGERPKLTPPALIAAAMARALADHPALNATYHDAGGTDGGATGGTITRHGAVHLGVAAQTQAGLVVPVIRDAQACNIWQLATQIARLGEGARAGTLERGELTGSTITLSSLGPLGGIAATPVLNRPEVAILAVGRIVERPAFADAAGERLRRASYANLSLTCDHRAVDGWDAARFMADLRRLLEAPALILAP